MLQEKLSLGDIQHFLVIKLCFFTFLIFGLFCIWKAKKFRPLTILGVAGILSAAAYLILVDNLGLMFWGLKGDEITIAAMYEMFAKHSFFSDFSYPGLPPFYPPLFFWIFSTLGRVFNWNGILIAKVGSAATILFLPILAYLAQHFYWTRKTQSSGQEAFKPGTVAWFVLPLLLFVLLDWDAVIIKPYEALAGVGAVLWTSFLYVDLILERWHWRRFLAYGLVGGLIFMTYYLWLIYGFLGLFFLSLLVPKEKQWIYYGSLVLVGGLILVFASPFLLPLVLAYKKFGTENWQTVLMTLNGISLHLPMLDVSWRGIIMLFGFGSLLAFNRHTYVRALLALLLTAYFWQVLGLNIILFFNTPIQEFKGFEFYLNIILAAGAAFGLEKVWQKIKTLNWGVNTEKAILSGALLLLASKMIFGAFADDPVVQIRRVESVGPRKTVVQLVNYLREGDKSADMLTLHSGISELSAFVPVNNFIYFNQHNSHPAALFSARYAYLSLLAGAKNEDEFASLAQNSPYGGIKRLVFFRHEGQDKYVVYLHLDQYPHGAVDKKVFVPKKFVTTKHFRLAYENSEFVVWEAL